MSTSGMNELKKNKLALSFDDTTICPYCGNNGGFNIETESLKHVPIKVRYKCPSCGFTCPVIYNIEDSSYSPAYKGEVYEFISTFGTGC